MTICEFEIVHKACDFLKLNMDYKKGVKIGIHKLVNLALIGAALGLIVTSIIVYNTWPIYTATNIIPQEEAKFPDLTFCSLSNGYKEQVLKVNYLWCYR